MTSYEDLVDATLAHGLMPLVVPQLKTIILGGVVADLTLHQLPTQLVRIAASSCRCGW